jgi:hypothetical protein
MTAPLRPAQLCRQLLLALAASEGRRRRRQRDTTPDAIGLGLKCQLLEETIRRDPEAEEFEAWLFERAVPTAPGHACPGSPGSSGALLATARALLEEWRLAAASSDFTRWLEQGAPSEDA